MNRHNSRFRSGNVSHFGKPVDPIVAGGSRSGRLFWSHWTGPRDQVFEL